MDKTFLKHLTISSPQPRRLLHIHTGNYPYVCARVKAKRSHLLPKDIYQKLLMMDIAEITRFIGESTYKQDINTLALTYKGIELIELALHHNMATIYHQILGFCEGDLKTMLTAYLQHADIHNIKTLLRAKHNHITPEELKKTIIPAGTHPEQFWNHIIQNTTTLEETIEAFKNTPYYPILQPLKEKPKHTTLTHIENNLEQHYYQHLLHTIHPTPQPNTLFLDFIKKEIDLLNIKTLIMTKTENLQPDHIKPLIIPGGNLTEKHLTTLINTPDLTTFFTTLQQHKPYQHLKEQPTTTTIRHLEQHHLHQITQFSYQHPLSILPILEYLIRKKIEIDNIRIIARGKHAQLPNETIQQLLVVT